MVGFLVSTLIVVHFQNVAPDYVFVPSDVMCVVILGDNEYHGKLDRDGNFFPSPHLPPNPQFKSSGAFDLMYRRDLNKIRDQNGCIQVYEFRSGVLVTGILKEGEFIPEVGGKIIRFSDYVFSPAARSIYNLPGKFVSRTRMR